MSFFIAIGGLGCVARIEEKRKQGAYTRSDSRRRINLCQCQGILVSFLFFLRHINSHDLDVPAPQAIVGQLRSHLLLCGFSTGTASCPYSSPEGEVSFSLRRMENFMVALKGPKLLEDARSCSES